MKFVADLHIHSHFSRATSKNLTFEHLARWAQLKGVHVVGTGDISHPGWLAEMRDKLIPAEDGLYRLKDEYARPVQDATPPSCQAPVRFLLGGEISNIYKRGERTRKVHNVVFAPSLDAVARLQERLERIGNIRSDGRPILGLDSRDLLEILLETDLQAHLIPAHIWTPWFSVLGSKSGFDSIEECYADLTPHIFALETGLSSDPPMNRRVSSLDRYTLVSSSDAHSPEKLAREATLFDADLSYTALFAALECGEAPMFGGTVEFFPEEGKYHLDGHRSCGVVWEPSTTRAHGGICTGCGKEVTIGVMHRVEELADRVEDEIPTGARCAPFHSLIPLGEVLGEVFGVGASSRQVQQEYHKLLGRLGPELFILREAPIEDLRRAGGERVAEAIVRMRRGEVVRQPGYDGEFGVIRLFAAPGAAAVAAGQFGLFAAEDVEAFGVLGAGVDAALSLPAAIERSVDEVIDPAQSLNGAQGSLFDLTPAEIDISTTAGRAFVVPAAALLGGLNETQRTAVQCRDAVVVIVAGPGTGKTRTLTHRIAYLVLAHGVDPATILAITFTNKAAGEMVGRLDGLLGERAHLITVRTFHAFGAALLRTYGEAEGIDAQFSICTEEDRDTFLREAGPELSAPELHLCGERISRRKNGNPVAVDPRFDEIFERYERLLAQSHALDFDDLVTRTVHLLERRPEVLAALQERYRWISVDEYQDVNPIQARFLDLLAQGGAGLCVIGDPDQAIYGFRGASSALFQAFIDAHPDARVLHLSENYRSTQMILDAAVQVVSVGATGVGATDASGPALGVSAHEDGAPDRGQAARGLRALGDFAEQVKLEIYAAPTDRAEAEYVVHRIEQMVGGVSYFSIDSGRAAGASRQPARSFADFAVLYRVGRQSALLIEAFERSGMPYQSTGRQPLYAYADVRRFLDYLWVLHNPRSRLHLHRILAADKHPVPTALLDEISAGASGDLPQALRRVATGREKPQRDRLHQLAALLVELRTPQPVARQLERLRLILRVQPEPAGEQRFERLLRKAGGFGEDLAAFLLATTLENETDAYDERADRVTLMTLHAAKGLEFSVVFIVGCEEGLLPYVRPGEPGAANVDEAEERRLFYVGMTRAQEKLVLCHARRRFLYGQPISQPPSRFVNDIASALKEVREVEVRRMEKKREESQLTLF